MKKNIHPKVNNVTIQCRCGRSPFTVVSTMPQTSFGIEHCLECLPMNTGVFKTKSDGDSARARLFRDVNISDLESSS